MKKQTFQPLEIVVVDNASTDQSLQLLARFAGITVLAQPQNFGFAKGNNLAIEQMANAQWIALLNPDAFPEPTWLEELVKCSESRPEFDAFGSKLLSANEESKIDGFGDVYHVSGLAWRDGYGKQDSSDYAGNREVFSVCAGAAMYRRQVFLELGGFDEDFFCYFEDVDLGFRLRLAGYRSLQCSKSIVKHLGSATSGGPKSDFSTYYGHRNLVWTFAKNMPLPLLWVLLPIHVAMNLISIIYLGFKGKFKVIIKAKFDAIVGLPGAIKKRSVIQRSRRTTSIQILRLMSKLPF